MVRLQQSLLVLKVDASPKSWMPYFLETYGIQETDCNSLGCKVMAMQEQC